MFVFILPGILGVGMILPQRWGLFVPWLIVLGLMLVTCAILGLSRGMGLLGILIDPARNMMSLSRLQVVLWTCVILSAFVTTALARAWDYQFNQAAYVCEPVPTTGEGTEPECADPLGIQLPPLLWALMGISVTSAVASPLLQANKAQRTAEKDRIEETKKTTEQAQIDRAVAMGEPYRQARPVATYSTALDQRKDANASVEEAVGETPPLGAVVRKDSWQKADFSDVFTGEEVSNFGYVDIAKVQNFFFTMVAVVSYAVVLGVEMRAAGTGIATFFAFPNLPDGLIAVLGISHAGYLTDKGFTHSTPETPVHSN